MFPCSQKGASTLERTYTSGFEAGCDILSSDLSCPASVSPSLKCQQQGDTMSLVSSKWSVLNIHWAPSLYFFL